jgi:hypothetical protein
MTQLFLFLFSSKPFPSFLGPLFLLKQPSNPQNSIYKPIGVWFFFGGGGILQSLLQGLQPVFNRLESAFMIAGINPAP